MLQSAYNAEDWAVTLIRRISGKVRSLSRRFPRNVTCNICGWSGRRFASDQWHPYTVCWQCHSQVRHRLVVETWNRIEGLKFRDLVDGKRILHFAPEEWGPDLLQPRASLYRTADFSAGRVDERLDLCEMRGVANNSYDLLVAADVLEHVQDCGRALREMLRVIAPGGWAVLTAPQKDGLERTYDDPSITDPRERERVFGQVDHLRIFGSDLKDLVESAGFAVRVISAGDFSAEAVKRHVLFPPILSPHPLATNHRRVYFAQRPA